MSAVFTPCVDQTFMRPAVHLLQNYVRSRRRQEGGLTDELFLHLGVLRVLEGDESGRAFLQTRADLGQPVARTTWFDAFQSRRRLQMLEEVTAQSYPVFGRELEHRDHLAEFPELADHPVVAIDGHQIEHACHAMLDAQGQHLASGMIYGLCLHSSLMRPVGRFQGDGRRHHEWSLFKQRCSRWLVDEPRRGPAILVGDPAYIDLPHWDKARRQAMFITREKQNMKAATERPNDFDPDDPVNLGVLTDETVGYGCAKGASFRRISYRDPATGEDFVFVTTCEHLRPGLIALLYFLRWKIEKAYDVFKNKLMVTKAWGVGDTAAIMQAHFITLLHNLLTILLARLEQTGLIEQKVIDKQLRRRDRTPPEKRVPTQEMVRHVFILTCQFIRTVRNCLRYKIPWETAYPLFKQRMQCYL